MRRVRACDFCGDDATGLYEPLPPTIADGPRLSLCDGCRDRLSSIVDPLVERIEADPNPLAERSAAADRVRDEPATERDPDGAASDGGPTDPGDSGVGAPAGPATDRSVADESAEDREAAERPPETLEVSESRDASGRAQDDRARTPPGYRKVMRFLENRELPIDRSEAERLVASAYDLEAAAVTAAIDHAVQYGRLRELDGELKR